MDRLIPYCFAFGVEAVFALGLWALTWLNATGSATVRRWSVALILSWAATDIPGWFGMERLETFIVLTDVALGIAAGIDFCAGRRDEKRPLWLVGLVVSYIAQLLFHAEDDADKALLLNAGFAVQILLVSSEQACQRLGICLEPYLRPLRYTPSGASRDGRRFTYWLGGPPHRSAALCRAREQAERASRLGIL